MVSKENEWRQLAICLVDLLSVLLCGFCLVLNEGPRYHIELYELNMLCVLHIAVFYLSNQFKDILRRGYFIELRAVLIYSFYLTGSIALMMFMSKQGFSMPRTGAVLFVIGNGLLVYGIHCLIKYYYRGIFSFSKNASQVILITTSERLTQIAERMSSAYAWGGNFVAIALLDNPTELELPDLFHDIEIVSIDSLENFAIKNVVDEVFINLSRDYDRRISEYLLLFQSMGIVVSLNISAFDFVLPGSVEHRVRKLGQYNVLTFSTKFYAYQGILLKRLIDVIGALVGLVITFIVGLVLVPLIKLESPGPAIFAQNRVGRNGRIFKFYKFRSMYADAEERKKELEKHNEMQGLMFKMEDDPRITKIGKFIRRTSLDELPQFYNVLIGDMSLIGTRPPTEQEFLSYSASHKKRLMLKPGITGLWQVSGRSEIKDFEEIVNLDATYIDNWSIWLDLKILLKTIQIVLLRKGAR